MLQQEAAAVAAAGPTLVHAPPMHHQGAAALAAADSAMAYTAAAAEVTAAPAAFDSSLGRAYHGGLELLHTAPVIAALQLPAGMAHPVAATPALGGAGGPSASGGAAAAGPLAVPYGWQLAVNGQLQQQHLGPAQHHHNQPQQQAARQGHGAVTAATAALAPQQHGQQQQQQHHHLWATEQQGLTRAELCSDSVSSAARLDLLHTLLRPPTALDTLLAADSHGPGASNVTVMMAYGSSRGGGGGGGDNVVGSTESGSSQSEGGSSGGSTRSSYSSLGELEGHATGEPQVVQQQALSPAPGVRQVLVAQTAQHQPHHPNKITWSGHGAAGAGQPADNQQQEWQWQEAGWQQHLAAAVIAGPPGGRVDTCAVRKGARLACGTPTQLVAAAVERTAVASPSSAAAAAAQTAAAATGGGAAATRMHHGVFLAVGQAVRHDGSSAAACLAGSAGGAQAVGSAGLHSEHAGVHCTSHRGEDSSTRQQQQSQGDGGTGSRGGGGPAGGVGGGSSRAAGPGPSPFLRYNFVAAALEGE